MRFRNDISFLRAFSVLAVMLFHFEVPFFKGGFIGVDVFFVISGFLMTQIILNGIKSDTFSLRQFYIRRTNRIVPALCFMLAFVLLISTFFLFKSDIRLNAKYVFLSDFFVSNIYYWKYTDYFTSHDNILLHTWSLGVEWQFYLFYPLLILLLKNFYLKKENVFWGLLIGITMLSFILMIAVIRVDNNFAFYMLPTRFWELNIGGIAFYLSQKIQVSKTMKSILVSSSSVVLLLSALFVSSSFLWPSWYTLIPILSTVIILALNYDTIIFNAKPVKFFGDISYSLYLWHWPWFVFFQYFGFLGGYYTLVMVLISILSAYLSFNFVEKNPGFSKLGFAIIGPLVVGAFSMILFIEPQNPITSKFSLYRNEKFQIAEYQNTYIEKFKDKQFNPCHCFITCNQTTKEYSFENCLKVSHVKKNVLLIGDSHSAQYSSSMRKLKEINLLEVSAGYVFPFPNSRGIKDSKLLMNHLFKDFIPKHHEEIDLVIISVHWLMKDNPNLHYDEAEIKEGLQKTISYLDKYHIQYLFLGQTETYKLSFPKIMMLKYFGRKESDFLNADALKMNEFLKTIVPSENYIDLYQNAAIIKSSDDRTIPYMFDGNHYSMFGTEQVVEKVIKKRLNELFINKLSD